SSIRKVLDRESVPEVGQLSRPFGHFSHLYFSPGAGPPCTLRKTTPPGTTGSLRYQKPARRRTSNCSRCARRAPACRASRNALPRPARPRHVLVDSERLREVSVYIGKAEGGRNVPS